MVSSFIHCSRHLSAEDVWFPIRFLITSHRICHRFFNIWYQVLMTLNYEGSSHLGSKFIVQIKSLWLVYYLTSFESSIISHHF